MWSVSILLQYLEENWFSIQTNYDCLKLIPNLTGPPRRLFRRRLRLCEIEIDIVHRTGIKKNQAAGALSFILTDGADTTSIEIDIRTALIDATSNHNDEITLQYERCQATANIVGDNDHLLENSANMPTFEEFLQ